MVTTKNISIPDEQYKWVVENSISLSRLVQKAIREKMEDKSKS